MLTVDAHTLAEDALEGLADGVTLVDAAGRVAYMNPQAQAALGVTASEWLGRAVELLYAELGRAARSEELSAELAEQGARGAGGRRLEFTLRAPVERVVEAKW